MKQNDNYKVLDVRRSLSQRVVTNVLSYSFLAFCIWLSRGSTFWTLICGLLFLAGFGLQLTSIVSKSTNTFRSVKELQDWAKSLDA